MNNNPTHKYDDIIEKEYPPKNRNIKKHPPMALIDRAKIFAPFAALKGYEEAVAEKEKIVVPRVELSEESKEHLDEQLKKIQNLLGKKIHPVVTIVYFVKDHMKDGEDGEYIQFTGMVGKFEESSRLLQIVGKRFFLSDIYSIEGEDLEG